VERYIEGLMREIAPNLSDVAGPLLGARLITMAGGLDKLAQLPASTIQILGAHKAIFLHMTKGTKPPKHGILFQAKEVRSAPKKLRGKIARLLATKISIAARVDAYGSDRSIGKKLREEIDERLAKLRGG
jgi:rRNA biogenesis protein Nop56/Nop58